MLKSVGGEIILYQGLEINLPPYGMGMDIDTAELKPVEIIKISEIHDEQIWQRQFLPDDYEIWVRDEKSKQEIDANYVNYELEKYRQQEWHRRLYGIWYYINGKPVYIPGSYYFFLNWWEIKESYPEYRRVDLYYFYHWQYCVYDPLCYGKIQATKRRGAKTVKAACICYERVSRTAKAKGGIQSKKKDPDAKEVYEIHIISPFQRMPEFFIPVYNTLQGSKPANKLSFYATSVKGKNSIANLQNEQLKSEIDYREAEALAYDGTSLLVLICDERGKVQFNLIDAHLIVRKCCLDLRGNITGKMIVCTTVEEIGIEAKFPELWAMSNPLKRVNGKSTESGLYSEFIPADEAGDWDKFGEPLKAKNLEKIMDSRKLLENDSKALIAEIRKDPLNLREAFMAFNKNCHFDAMLLNELYDRAAIMEKEVVEYGNYIWKDGVPFTEAVWEVCNKEYARWSRPKNFKMPEGDKVEWIYNQAIPINKVQFISGVDPFQNDITEDDINSKASSGVLNRYEKGNNNEMYNKMIVSRYYARPLMASLFHMDMALQCFAFGCELLVEAKMDGGLRKFFIDNGLHAFLIYLPGKENAGIDPNQDNKVLLVNIWEEYINTEGRAGKIIYPSVIHQLGGFNVNETEKSDEVMGIGWTLVADYFKRANFKEKAPVLKVNDFFRMHKAS